MATQGTKKKANSGRTGRPSKLTPALQARFCKWVLTTGYLDLAARKVGVSRSSVRSWLQRGREQQTGKYRNFLDAVEEARASCETRQLLLIEKSNDWKAAAWRLKHMKPQRYSEKAAIRHEGKVSHGLTDETAERIRREILGIGTDD